MSIPPHTPLGGLTDAEKLIEIAAMIAHDYPSHAWALRACAVSVREMERALEELATETAEQEALVASSTTILHFPKAAN